LISSSKPFHKNTKLLWGAAGLALLIVILTCLFYFDAPAVSKYNGGAETFVA
jgi:hypothetical protein